MSGDTHQTGLAMLIADEKPNGRRERKEKKEEDALRLLRNVCKDLEALNKSSAQAIEKLLAERRDTASFWAKVQSILFERTPMMQTLRLLWDVLPADERETLTMAGFNPEQKRRAQKD